VREGKSEEAGRDGVVRVVDELYRRALKLRRIDLLNTLCSCDGVLQTEIADVPREAGDSAVIALGVAVDWNEVSTVESSAESAKPATSSSFEEKTVWELVWPLHA